MYKYTPVLILESHSSIPYLKGFARQSDILYKVEYINGVRYIKFRCKFNQHQTLIKLFRKLYNEPALGFNKLKEI